MQLCKGGLVATAVFLTQSAVWAAGPFFNIADYGAKNDGSAPATQAIRSAIQAAKAAGGGTVFIPAGNYTTGPFALASNLVLDIGAGATLHFPADRAELTYSKGRMEGVEGITPDPLINIRDLENVTITGRGTITTNNADWMKVANHPDARSAWMGILRSIEMKQPVPESEYQKAAPALRPAFIRTMNSKNVHINGIHIVGSSFWTIHVLYSNNVVIDGVTIETYPGHNTDGVDVDSSSDVRIANCYIDTGDDGIVLKSGKDRDGRRVNRPTERVAIVNCTVHHAHGAVVVGSETSGGVRDVVASNIVCDGTDKGVRVKSTRGRGAVVEDLTFDHWTMRNVPMAINVTNYYTRVPQEPVSDRTPIFRNINVSNMIIEGSPTIIDVEGLPEMPISSLRISNIVASGKVGMRAYNTDDMELHNVQLNAESGPTILVRDSKNLELDAVTTRKAVEGMPVVRLDHCPGTILRASKAFSGTGTFLSVAPGELKDVKLVGNVLDAASKPTEESAKDYWKSN
ncbi:MAG TPA: glycoside hydrolase family 28 protein [Bryobacteraceae bacterium]|nr:glycoside hydrolase family 28 protein [Bryobacteraceae bacterium]